MQPSVHLPGRGFVPALLLLSMAALTGSCFIQVGAFDRVYPCVANEDCADGFICFLGGAGSFCAPQCDPGCAGGEICTSQGGCIAECPDSGCPEGLSCIETGPLAYCSTSYPCDVNADCGSGAGLPFNARDESFCLSSVEENANVCNFVCDTSADCPTGFDCVCASGFDCDAFDVLRICSQPCTELGGCPPGYTCVDALALEAHDHCVPAYAPSECDEDIDCLTGQCVSVGPEGESVCDAPCQTDVDCLPLGGVDWYRCVDNASGGRSCVSPRADCGDLFCSFLEGEVCASALSMAAEGTCLRRCVDGIGCESTELCTSDAPDETGHCVEVCTGPADCTEPGFGCFSDAVGPGVGVCYPGLPGVGCDGAGDCVPGSICLDVGGGASVCMRPCAGPDDCAPLQPLTFIPVPPVYTCTPFMVPVGTYCWVQ